MGDRRLVKAEREKSAWVASLRCPKIGLSRDNRRLVGVGGGCGRGLWGGGGGVLGIGKC